MDPGRLAIDGLLLAILAGGAVTDVRTGKVRNALTYSAAAAGLLLNAIVRPAGLGLAAAGLGLLTGFVPLFLIYLGGGLGGGDVKLMAATGAFLGPRATLFALLYSCLVGAACAIGLILWREGPSGAAARALIWRDKTPDGGDGLARHRFPFALAILLGTAWLLAEQHSGRSLLDLVTGS